MPTMDPAQVRHTLIRATKAVMAIRVPPTFPTMLTASIAPAWAASSKFECSGFSFSRFSADVLLRLVSKMASVNAYYYHVFSVGFTWHDQF